MKNLYEPAITPKLPAILTGIPMFSDEQLQRMRRPSNKASAELDQEQSVVSFRAVPLYCEYGPDTLSAYRVVGDYRPESQGGQR